MADDVLYEERVTSSRTEAFFLALTLLCLTLFAWRRKARGLDVLAYLFLAFSCFFVVYVLNYRTLIIRLTAASLKLTFGLFTWTLPLDNVEDCEIDDVPLLKRMGGAGIHFMMVRKRYRASFNFLEYPRVVIALKRRRGPVQDLSFSTRRPDHLLPLLQEAVSASRTAAHGRPEGSPSAPPRATG